jgi:ribose transport system substrate-binding protein
MRRLLLGASALAFLAAPMAAQAQDTYTFALVPKAMNNPFFDVARDGCMDAAEELGNVECLYIGPGEHTEAEQVQIVQDLITRRVDGIAVSPSNAPAIARVLERAQEQGIPATTWDSDLLPEHQGARINYIGTLNYQIGEELANLINEYKPDGGTICIQSGGAAAANHNERIQGIRDTLAGADSSEPPGDRLDDTNGWTEISGCVLYTDDDSAVAVQQLQDILAQHADLDVFVSTGAFTQWSDNAYRQAIEPHLDRLENMDLVVVVADTLPMQMDQLRDGYSHGQVGQRPYEMGSLSMRNLLTIVEGGEVDDPIYTGVDVCTQDNVDTCLDAN